MSEQVSERTSTFQSYAEGSGVAYVALILGVSFCCRHFVAGVYDARWGRRV